MRNLKKNIAFGDIAELIEKDDLSPDMQLIEEVIGLENTIMLMREIGGSRIYIPKPSSLPRLIEKCFAHFKGNKRLTAHSLGMSYSYLSRLVRIHKWHI